MLQNSGMQNKEQFTIVSLNTWGGRLGQPTVDFFKHNADKVDIFCLQEVYDRADPKSPVVRGGNPNLFWDMKLALPQHRGFYVVEQEREEGIAMFLKQDIAISSYQEPFIYRWKNAKENDGRTLGRAMQAATVWRNARSFTIAHFHGLWNGQGKTDTTDRFHQSHAVKTVLDRFPQKQVLVGDFNLNPETGALNILEDGMVNLIKTHKIESTRTSFYPKERKYADYALVTPDVKVDEFKVLPDQISDHAPLYLKVSI